MLHPVGPLPAAVYWRRRLVVLAVLLAVLGLLAWLVVGLTGDRGAAADAPTGAAGPSELPALERVMPSVSGLRTPATTAAAPVVPEPAPAGPAPGDPCADDMLDRVVRAPGEVAVGSKPTLELAVTNTSPVPCVRALDKQLQELVMVDGDGARVWCINECIPYKSIDQRTIAPA